MNYLLAVVASALFLAVVGIVFAIVVHPLLYRVGLAESGVREGLFDSIVLAGLGYWGGRNLALYREADGWHRRGAVVSDAGAYSKALRVRRGGADREPAADHSRAITLAGLPVAAEDETKHFKLIGTTGTGKSTAIREILSAALARGDRAVIADPDGGYLNNFYNAERGM